jgi:hypothetical protein
MISGGPWKRVLSWQSSVVSKVSEVRHQGLLKLLLHRPASLERRNFLILALPFGGFMPCRKGAVSLLAQC